MLIVLDIWTNYTCLYYWQHRRHTPHL